MKREGLSLFQAKRVVREMADEHDEPCIMYAQTSATGAKHFGVVTSRAAKDWQLSAARSYAWPMEVGDAEA